VTPVLRGVFGRHEGEQRWFPGSSSALVAITRADLEAAFPVVRSSGPLAVDTWPGRGGATWIRNIDGTWYVARAVLPAWSVDRSIPAWAVVGIDDATFGASPVLRLAMDSAALGVSEPSRWISGSMPAPALSWDASAIARAGQLLDELAMSPGNGAAIPLDASALDDHGLVALQCMMHAMHRARVGPEAAVILSEPSPVTREGWPTHVMVAADALGGAPIPAALTVGAMPIARYVRSVTELSELLHRAICGGSSMGRAQLEQAAHEFIPLRELPASAVPSAQLEAWAREVTSAGSESDGLRCAELIFSDSASTTREVLAGLHLLAAWAERHPGDAERGVRNVINRRVMDRGAGTSPA